MSDPEKTPRAPNNRPAPVVVRSGHAPPTRYAPAGWTVTPGGLAPVRASSVPDVEAFADADEEPTRPDGKAAQAACLLSDWNACEPEAQAFLLRTARRLADIVRKRKAPIPNGRY